MTHGSAPCRLLPVAAVAFLAACAPAHDARSLFKDLQSMDLETREDAAAELEAIVRKGDYRVFLRGIESSEGLFKAQSIVYLARVERPDARKALRELLGVEKRTMIPYNPIRRRPSSEESDSRILVASLIADGGGDPEAVGTLTARMDDQPPEIVANTCFALGALRDPRAIPFLASAARQPDIEVARAAVQALGHFRQPEAVAALKEAASSPAIEVRTDVLTSLELEEDPGALDLLKAMGAGDQAPEIRSAAIAQIGRYKDPSLVPYLIERLHDKDALTRTTTAQTLQKLTGQSLGQSPERWSRWWSQSRKGQAPTGSS